MPTELEQSYADLARADPSRRGSGKRKRGDELDAGSANPRAEVRRLANENERLNADLADIRARLAESERVREEREAEHDRIVQHVDAHLDRIAAQDAQLAERDARMNNQAAQIDVLQRTLDRFAANPAVAPGPVQPPIEHPAAQPPSRDYLTPNDEQYRDILPNGSRPPRIRSFREPIAVARPPSIRSFVRNGGLPDEGHNQYIIPPGVNTEPHRSLLPEGQPADRPSTPVADRPARVTYEDKVYYHIAVSNTNDADRLGLKFEPKAGSTWAEVPAFRNDRGLWYCNNPAIDRNTLSHLTQRDPRNGDYLRPDVQPSQQILMNYRDRSSRGR